jgi:hypothetical protein
VFVTFKNERDTNTAGLRWSIICWRRRWGEVRTAVAADRRKAMRA